MSVRTIIEINHDKSQDIEESPEQFTDALLEFLRGTAPEAKERLERFGFRVAWVGHHSTRRGVSTEHECIEL